LMRHRAHLLNRTAAAIWRRCDGRTTIEEMTASLPELGLPADPTVVHYALAQLQRAHLLEAPVTAHDGSPPGDAAEPGQGRSGRPAPARGDLHRRSHAGHGRVRAVQEG